MNAYQTSRRQKLADLIANPNVPMKERFESIAGLLEEEIRSAYDPRLTVILEWISAQYANGRVTEMGDEELDAVIARLTPDLHAHLCKQAKG